MSIPIRDKASPLRKGQHPAARCTHPDGSAVNICEKCINYDPNGPGSIADSMVGFCTKHKVINMWFGNCDDWWPVNDGAERGDAMKR
jgi:hypothetical protein